MAQQVLNQEVWSGILEAERLSRYYSALADKSRRKHQWFSVCITLAATAAAGALLAQLHELLSAVILVSVAGATIWNLYADYSGRATMADITSSQYRDLLIEWKELWYGGGDTRERIKELQRWDNRIAEKYPLSEDDKLAQEAQEVAYERVPLEYGS